MFDLSRKGDRRKLVARREPYWQRLGEGAYLGFRSGPDTWVTRYRDRSGRQQYRALKGATEYDAAKRAAEEWIGQLAGSGMRSARRGTVRQALDAYLVDLRRHGRVDTATDAEARFKLCIWEDPIADVELEAVAKVDFLEWRDRLRDGRQKKGRPVKPRQPRSINRHVRAIAAGLNCAVDLGHVGNPRAWLLEPLQDDIDDEGATAVFPTAEQRSGLIGAADANAAAFLRGLELTGARPKELAAATVADFSGDSLKLSHRKGRPAKLRARHVVLGADGIAFFRDQCRRKLPPALIFTEDGEQPWRRHAWARAVRSAIAAHNKKARGKSRIPDSASAYSFRHARISELLQVYGVDPLTVAQQTGTSLAMIEKSYLRFIPSAMKAKLERPLNDAKRRRG